MDRIRISSGAQWEDIVGYSRAIRVGNLIEVAGTTAIREGKIIGEGDAYQQTYCILEIIRDALEAAGSSMEEVVRTRIYTTDIRQWRDIGKAHGAFFKKVKPASSMIEVSALVDPGMLVEIEATAIGKSEHVQG